MVSTTPQTKRIKVMDVNSNLAQEALRKRQEDEDRQAQQAEFLNRSLRGSRKLQALESHPSPPPPQGVINDGYSSEDTEDATSAPGGVKEDLHSIISEYSKTTTRQTHRGTVNVELAQGPRFTSRRNSCATLKKKKEWYARAQRAPPAVFKNSENCYSAHKEHCKNKGYKTSDVSKSNRKAENMAEN
uniref:Uncharacterized protein n=1 Tax=Timema bartmani TaxID=61472 RepID=A0A7R9EY99_9NEOP|nr:unnamed protein product [Timema bartmani]